jgi:Fe-S cluster assembly protein SufD
VRADATAEQTRATAPDVRAHYVEVYRARGRRSEPAWCREARERAIARFAELGFPTTRDEDWRFTNLAPLARTPFRSASADGAQVTAAALAPFALQGGDGPRLVFVDGRFAPGLSRPGHLPGGVVVEPLARAFDRRGDLLEAHLARYADPDAQPFTAAFTALNTALFEDGALVWVPKGVAVEAPVHLLFVATPAADGSATHPRTLVVAEPSSEVTVVEHYAALGDGVYFSNAVTEVVAGANAVVRHLLLEEESLRAYNVSTLRVQQGRDSQVASHTVLLGGALVRNNVHPVLAGEGTDCLVNGLFLGRDAQHLDNYMRVEHAAPHGNSRQFYHGILDEGAHGVFHGRIVVHPGAQKTDAKQTNRNLLLSGDAQIDTKPQLEIYADDVKCTHGATIGQLEEDQLFYLRSRGLSEEDARGILLFGFANESLERIGSGPVRRHVERLVRRWLEARRAPRRAAGVGAAAGG